MSPVAEREVGRMIGRKYRVIRAIGGGGMGRVYEAENTWTGLHVAIKVLHAELAAEAGYVERFRREARSAARISHPNAVAILDLGEDDDGSLFMVQELLQGESLDVVIAREGALPYLTVIDLFEQVADATAYAHEAMILHRDLKPANIVLSNDPRRGGTTTPKIVDFGLAKMGMQSTMTPTGVVLGSPAYLAPEQIIHGKSTERSDQYALGVCLYEALTGQLPFRGGSLPVLALQIMEGKIEPVPTLVPEVPAALDAVVMRALATDPPDRYESVAVFREALLGSLAFARKTEFAETDQQLPVWEEETRADGPADVVVPFVNDRLLGSLAATTELRRAGNERLTIGHTVAARGLDIESLRHALQVELPAVWRTLRYATYEELVYAVCASEVDVGLMPPAAFLRAEQTSGVRLLAIPELERSFTACVLLGARGRADLDGLEGARVAWVDPASTTGYLVPRQLLRWADVALDGLEERFYGSHEAVVAALHNGAAELGASWCTVGPDGEILAGPFLDSHELTVLAVSEPVPNVVVCMSPGLDGRRAEQVTEVLANQRARDRLARAMGFDRLVTQPTEALGSLARRMAQEAETPRSAR